MCAHSVFVWSTAAQEEGGGAGVGVGVGVMSECDQASVVCMPLAPPRYLYPPPPWLSDHTQDGDWAHRLDQGGVEGGGVGATDRQSYCILSKNRHVNK